MITPRDRARRLLLAQALGLALALLGLQFVRTHLLFDFNEAALGEYTSSLFGKSQAGEVIHCTGVEIEPCVGAWRTAGRPAVTLWFGNSQLHGVNRYGPGDKTAVMQLHDALARLGRYVIGYSLPNMTIPEAALAWQALSARLEVKTVLLPVVFNALRNAAIRDRMKPLLADEAIRPALLASSAGRHLAVALTETAPNREKLEKTTAIWVEDYLEAGLSNFSPLWRDRAQVRTLFDYLYYQAWHKLAGATAQSKRSLVGAGYQEQMALLEALVIDLHAGGARVIIYAPPYRQDIPGPYIEAEYWSFKDDLAAIAARHSAIYVDLDNVVDGLEWGMVRDPVFGFEDYDFMHFTARGHARLAEAMLLLLSRTAN
jgi:hypothetical protein